MKITSQQYAQTLLELTENKSQEEISAIVQKFAEQLKKDGQLKNADKIMDKFAKLFNTKNGIVEAIVTTAHKMDNGQIEQVEKFIKEKYSAKTVEIENVVDEKIKGGIIVRVEDEVIDGSLSNHLKRMQKVLAN
jgi:F-type H+-transporting ATPase subunit delta